MTVPIKMVTLIEKIWCGTIIFAIQPQRRENTAYQWIEKLHTIASIYNKHCVERNANHFNNTSSYYSFGNKGTYKTDGNELVGQYTSNGSKLAPNVEYLMKKVIDIKELCAL